MLTGGHAVTRSRGGGLFLFFTVVMVFALVLIVVAVVRQPPSQPVVAFVGDSYTAGSPEDTGYTKRYPSRVAAQLRVDVDVLAQPGAGYVTPGIIGARFVDEVEALEPDTDVVVIWGSRNDPFDGGSAEAIGRAAGELLDAVKRQAPSASLIVIGPTYVERPVPVGGKANAAAISQAALARDVPFIDALDWLQTAQPGKVGSDGTHPTDQGHALIARKIAPLVSEVLAAP